MADESSLDSINQAISRLLRLNASRSAFARSTAAAGVRLTQPAYVLLRSIREGGPIAMGELARVVHMDPATTARQVAKLVAAGLARRREDSSDARLSLIEATRKGAAASDRLLGVRMQHLTTSIADWSDRDVRTFAKLLSRFVDDMAATSYEEQAP